MTTETTETALTIILGIGLFFAVLAFAMSLWNLSFYNRAPSDVPESVEGTPAVTVCVPARNEEANIEACVCSVLASELADIEVLVYDDGSTDRTPEILASLAEQDARVRACPTEPLPAGWNGKQHACWQMSRHARAPIMLFTDADVRFEPAAIGSALAAREALGAGMLSTFPRQITGTLSEKLVVPMIFFILFSYLPFVRMRTSMDPGTSAACGQFILLTREAYDASGGHESVGDSMHEGVKLPRLVRKAGHKTDLFDGTDLCSVRMYRGLGETWRGFAKNAYEGLGSPIVLVVFTTMHVLGHLVPPAVLIAAALGAEIARLPLILAAAAVALGLIERLILSRRMRTSIVGALLHPIGVLMMTLIQWHSLYLHVTGKRSWRGRSAGHA